MKTGAMYAQGDAFLLLFLLFSVKNFTHLCSQ